MVTGTQDWSILMTRPFLKWYHVTRVAWWILLFEIKKNYCKEHSMRLNPRNCKEMVVNFMGNPNTIMRPLYIGNQMVERISSYKLLGVIINGNLKWNCHFDSIVPLRHQRNCTLSDYLSELACKNKTCWKWPYSSYSEALSLANETTLSNRRELLCHKFMAEMTDTRDHPLSCLVSTAVQRTKPYNLRPGPSCSKLG